MHLLQTEMSSCLSVMNNSKSLEIYLQRAINPNQVHGVGHLTHPRSYSVYELPFSVKSTRRFRFGNYPIRQTELVHEFGQCALYALFLERDTAKAVADLLNHIA